MVWWRERFASGHGFSRAVQSSQQIPSFRAERPGFFLRAFFARRVAEGGISRILF